MRPFPLYLNELSLSIQNIHPIEKLALVLGFVDTLKKAKKERSDVELHSSLSLYDCNIGNGDFLCTILKGNNYVDHWRFLGSLAQKNPWGVSNLTADLLTNGQRAIGIALARENRSAAISLASAEIWKSPQISVTDIEESVPNISAPEHVNFWGNLLRDFGSDISTSSVVFQDGSIQIRMYLNDHNPPHIHVEYPGYKATINIRTFDILEGRLPPQISRSIVDWAKQKQLNLLENWERCRVGAHPNSIEN